MPMRHGPVMHQDKGLLGIVLHIYTSITTNGGTHMMRAPYLFCSYWKWSSTWLPVLS